MVLYVLVLMVANGGIGPVKQNGLSGLVLI